MKSFIGLVALLATITVGAAHAAESHIWTGWNAKPFAESQSDACKRAKQAINGFKQMPVEAKQYFIGQVGTSCANAEKDDVWLTPGMQRVEMWDTTHPMQNVVVGELPVTKSPDGRRTFRKGAVADAARAKQWSYEYKGRTIVLNLQYVCFNWNWGFGPKVTIKVVQGPRVIHTITKYLTPPPPPAPHCFTYDMDTRGEPNASRPAVTDLEFYQHSGNPEDANRVFTDNGGCLHAIDLETGEHLSLVKGCGGCELYTHSRQVGLPRDVDERTAATLILHIVQENGKYGCPSGHCRIFLPVGWVKETSLLWCWLAKLTYTYGKMTMFAYFYGITNAENAADVPNGRYHVTVTPIDHL